MNYPRLALLLVVILVCAGCGVRGVTSMNPRGDSVTNQAGKGTGTVAGVKIEVLGLEEKNAAVIHSVKIAKGVEETAETDYWEVDFGEVNLILERDTDGPISLTVDGRQYGTVVEEDELVVDANRKVFVNGQERTAR